ncbi:FecR domain-containing protein [Pseudomonas sp. LS-2]|uniref:FecR domain-containing protein n=1 Tax=Pseudomonas sp. LS-2 TaxID=2315859 RepID=UPI002115928D|nr:FecR family protein [Pseudomonas sp. LS-2]
MNARTNGLGADSLNRPDISPQVAEQAVNWLIEMQGGGLDSARQQAWQLWLNSHSDHQRAWAHIQRVNQRLNGLSSPLAHAAINAPTSSSRRQALKLLLLLGAGSVAAWGVRDRIDLPPLLADYRSRVGERRKEALADGSQLQMNTATALDVQYDSQQRLIKLLEGEILMTVADDPRPLALMTAEGSLRAIGGGARFNLRQLAGRTQLAVFAGAVELSPYDRHGAMLMVKSAQQVTFSRDAWDAVRPVDSASGAWADGMLVAAHMRLADFLAELSRYRRGRLNCDPKVADLLISGSYPLNDSERILDMLEVSLPVKVQRFTRYWVTVEKRV